MMSQSSILLNFQNDDDDEEKVAHFSCTCHMLVFIYIHEQLKSMQYSATISRRCYHVVNNVDCFHYVILEAKKARKGGKT